MTTMTGDREVIYEPPPPAKTRLLSTVKVEKILEVYNATRGSRKRDTTPVLECNGKTTLLP